MQMRELTVLAVVCLLGACQAVPPELQLGAVEFSRPGGSGEPNLSETADGGVLLSWIEPTVDGRSAVRVAYRGPNGWDAPVVVRESDRLFVNWADFPSVVELADGSWVAHWLEKVSPATYAYHVNVAISDDRGASWSDAVVPHRDDSPSEHGFVSMVPWGVDEAAIVWLDGRAMDLTGGIHDRGAMTIRFTTVGSDGRLGAELLLDERTCECCQTALAVTSRGLVAAYRDRSTEEIRDIAVVRFADGEWSPPTHVARDNWHYPGCPVNGPQLSAVGDTVAIAWFTAPEQQARVQVAFSVDGGETFGEPVRVDDGWPSGRVDITLLPDGSALVTWLELIEPGAEIRARRVTRAGEKGNTWTAATTAEARGSGFPRIARSGNQIVFAWRLLGPDGGIRVAAATLDD